MALPPPPPPEERVNCDAISCEESHPRFHEETGPGFKDGKWLGWFYLDLNRPDLSARPLRFCSMLCLVWWLSSTKTAQKAIRPENREAYEDVQAILLDFSPRGGD